MSFPTHKAKRKRHCGKAKSFNDPTGLLYVNDMEQAMGDLDSWMYEIANRPAVQYGGGDGGRGDGGGGSASNVSGGFSFTGSAAQSVFTVLQNAYNSPDDDGNWHFTVGSHNGQIGFWEPFIGTSDGFSETGLQNVVGGSKFVTWSDYFGNALWTQTDNNTQKAWYGNFVGPGPDQNPFKLVGPNGGYLKPIDMVDAAAQRHDYAYWKANTGGIKGALFNTAVRQADLDLAHDAEWVILFNFLGLNDQVTGRSISPAEYHWAIAITIAFTDLGTLKSF